MAVEDSEKVDKPDRDRVKAPPAFRYGLILFLCAVIWMTAEGFLGQALIALVCLILFLVPAGIYVYAPYHFKRKFWLSTDPEIWAIDADSPETPPIFTADVGSMAEAMGKLGFVERERFFVEKLNSSTSLSIALFESRAERTFARWMVVGSRKKVTGPTLVFATRFSDGSEVVTTNHGAPPLIPLPRTRKSFPFPDVQDPARLFGLHRRALAEVGDFSTRQDPSSTAPIVHLRDLLVGEHANMAEAGYFRLEPSSGLYRLTWRGAYLTAWKLLWPWGPIRQANYRAAAARRLRSWEGLTS